ncbi:YIP1 family protein [Paenibacillus spongiae]|uniref:YIP1 family protein n=1 Tax=Paenibacillus spongiae TaxID=2909671 RepID=A0ABY5S178_9BACL|nr:YIP1 family protein [Paenibacillus spongiae]UVI27305.1 YIP1 family protein [Paenibacillus spongiae]
MNDRAKSGLTRAALTIMVALCLLGTLFPTGVSAQIPYRTMYKDPQTWQQYRIQPLYVPDRIIDGNSMDIPLSSPSDIFIAGNDHVYVADTGNDRIVELNAAGEFVRSIGIEEGQGKLNQPEGVFVADDGTIYVANSGGRNIVKFAANGQVENVFGKPESNLLYDDYHFIPTKLVVDSRGVMYIIVKDTHQGLMRLNPEGKFTGFFGANKTKLDWMDRLKRTVLNKEQLAKEIAKRPNAIENVTLTQDGFLVTASFGKPGEEQIKKLNAGGVNAFKGKPINELQLVDMAVDRHGFLYGINREGGDMTIYDPTADSMFYFGAGEKTARQLGVTSFPTSIAINGKNELWLADSGLNLIHVYKRTAFGETFLTAAHFYFEGEYEESKSNWEALIRENGMLNISYNGLGKIALHEQDYDKALAYFKMSNDSEGYSEAFWNIRYDWIRKNLLVALLLAAAAVWGAVFLSRRTAAFARSRTWPAQLRQYGGELRDALYLIVHPYEGFYRLKDRKISWTVIVLILALALGTRIFSLFGQGFLAFPFDRGALNIKFSLGVLIVPWLTWVIANYLVSSVKGGEGRFREVVQSSTFAIVPYIMMTIPITLLSNVLVNEEWIVIELMTNVMWVWVFLLLFVMTQVIHNFDFLEAIKNAGITLFTIGVIWLFVVIVSGLGVNLYDFLTQIYREVTFNG